MSGSAPDGLTCRGCGGPDAFRVVDLGDQPASDLFAAPEDPAPDPVWPLELWACPRCALVQLGPVAALVEEPPRAVESSTSQLHAARTVAAVLAEHPHLVGSGVAEFASHHGGSWLPALAGYGCRPGGDGEPAALVVDVHALAHEEDLREALARRAAALEPDGLLVVEHHHLLPLLEQGQYDTVRHGHWSYLSLIALERLAAALDLRPVRAVAEPVFGGSLRVVLARNGAPYPVDETVGQVLEAERAAGLEDGAGCKALADRAAESAAALHRFLQDCRAEGRRVLGYGAPSKAAVLLGVARVGPELLEFTVDAAPLKHGLTVPGVRVPIRPVAHLAAARPDVVLILTWDIADEVVAQLEAAGGWGAEYVVPLPAPHRVGGTAP